MTLPKLWHRKGRGWFVTINQRQIPLGTSQKAAEKAYKKIVMDEGLTSLDKGGLSFRDLVEEYWDWYTARREASTWKSRQYLYTSLMAWAPKSLNATQIRPFHVDKWMRSKHKVKQGGAARKQIAFVKGITKWGLNHGFIPVDPLAGMPLPSDTPRQEFIPPNLFELVVRKAPSQELKDFLLFALDPGARPQEIRNLEASHFDGEKFTYPISDSKGREESRVLYLTPTSLAIAKRLIKKHPEGPIFRTPKSRYAHGPQGAIPWSRSSLNTAMRKLRDRINEELSEKRQLISLTPYMLRHSFAHYRISQGQDINLVAALMGHKDTKMVMRRYGHLSKGTILSDAAKQVMLPGRKSTENSDPSASD